jgi:hypothetical protein
MPKSQRRNLALWGEHHEHRAPFHVGGLFDVGYILQFFCDLAQVFKGELGVGNLTTSEAHSHADFDVGFEPTAGILDLKTTVMVTSFWAQTDLFDLDLGLGFTRFAFLLFFLVKELTVIDDFGYRRFDVGGDLYQVKPCLISQA